MQNIQQAPGSAVQQNRFSKKSNIPGPGKKGRFDLKGMLQNQEMQAALLSGVLMLTGWLVSPYSGVMSVILYIVSYTAGGWQKAKEGVETLIQERDLDVNLLMVAAALGAAAIGYWNEGAMLIFIFALSGALESYTNERSKKDISSLMALKPETALKIENGEMKQVSIEQLQIGDLFLVKPGELIPADGSIQRGLSSVNQSSITGESLPADKVAGDEVFAGTLNGEGVLYVEVTKSAESTVFAKIIRLVEEAESEVPDSQRFMKRFESVYARIVVAVTLLLIFLTPLVLNWSFSTSFYKAMVFLVVASPCALVSSIMPATLSAISNRARRGILFKGGAHVENMALTSVVAFDKTGTLTLGKPEVTDFIAADGYDHNELLSVCASIEQLSEHPLARAIVRKAEDEEAQIIAVESGAAVTGWGMEGEAFGKHWRIGKTDMLDSTETEQDTQLNIWRGHRSRLNAEGKTVSIILDGDQVAGMIAMQDIVRPQAAEAVARLQAIGVKVAMLTGDRYETAKVIGEQVGADLIYADLLPEEKVTYVQQLREKYGHVVMVGDGVNDAPALATATVGMGMGMHGSGTALEVADVVLMNDNIEEIAPTITVSRRAQRIVKQNMVFAISMILLLMAGNFVTGIALPLGVVGHEGSTILVILNGLRLLL
ncbi:heavy metal translocating P-type ATPase [Paenibacillus pini]|uniref:Lead, cadmium, zinc and mercury transporting ATPase n=1 Tax=Paenibacillus pini JCM 16418 TaxID=1236976 RepID=W7YT55_9BACL|nr:heavy metal translocating P-type ATPase [Paenibacillus pini]GAF10378.1 lead, cadmium, zinc and mercury transporting ATPase [Paenibacillus pini JCM 16418]